MLGKSVGKRRGRDQLGVEQVLSALNFDAGLHGGSDAGSVQ